MELSLAFAPQKSKSDFTICIASDSKRDQEARSVLPNSLKTSIVITMNLREWHHFFELRTAPDAHPQMREIAIPLCQEFKREIPVMFDNILY